MSLIRDALPLLLSLAAIGAILYLSWRMSRYLAQKTSGAQSTRNIKIIERAVLAQDKGLIIAEICGEFCLLGFSNDGIQLLKSLDPKDLIAPDSQSKPDFASAFRFALSKGLNLSGRTEKIKNNGRRNDEK